MSFTRELLAEAYERLSHACLRPGSRIIPTPCCTECGGLGSPGDGVELIDHFSDCILRRVEAELLRDEPPCAEWVWVYEDQLPKDMSPAVYTFLYPHSKLDGVRLFPWPTPLSYPPEKKP